MAPATLTFHDAGDLRIAVGRGDTGGRVAPHELAIDRITREPARNQKVCLDRPFYRTRPVSTAAALVDTSAVV